MPETEPKLEDVVTHQEVAQFLGLPEKSLHAYRIPHIKMGRSKLYFKDDVARWLRSRRDAAGGR